ncbi:clavesin-1-like [Ctenocephalides felis]|uniref:clavesin-1-like n=1 Tax=Ctenocephalides felis TaxID=7515 RepID=UPI000E6E353B|nr:clavesin-1-like [Ctenocephalides felis]
MMKVEQSTIPGIPGVNSGVDDEEKFGREDVAKILKKFKKNLAGEKFLTEPDDRTLMTFLRTKRYDLVQAEKLLKTYDEFRRKHGQNWLKISKTEYKTVFASGVLDLLDEKDKRGRRVLWLRAGKWIQKLHTADQCLKIGGLMAELAFLIESQVDPYSGCVAIIDMEGFSMTQLKGVTPSFVRKLMHYLVSCLAMRIFTAHVIRESSGFAVVFALFRKFIDDRMRKRIFFHQHDMNSLADSVGLDILPLELGGPCLSDPEKWVRLLDDPKIIQELEKIGYTFVED